MLRKSTPKNKEERLSSWNQTKTQAYQQVQEAAKATTDHPLKQKKVVEELVPKREGC